MYDGIGRFCATGGLTLTLRFCNDGAIESENRAASCPARAWLSYACRVGTSPAYLACLASRKTDWPGKFEPIPWVYADIVRNLARVERVRILVKDAAAENDAKKILSKAGADLKAVDFYRVPTDRGWIRDFGPIFVRGKNGELAATHWLF